MWVSEARVGSHGSFANDCVLLFTSLRFRCACETHPSAVRLGGAAMSPQRGHIHAREPCRPWRGLWRASHCGEDSIVQVS